MKKAEVTFILIRDCPHYCSGECIHPRGNGKCYGDELCPPPVNCPWTYVDPRRTPGIRSPALEYRHPADIPQEVKKVFERIDSGVYDRPAERVEQMSLF